MRLLNVATFQLEVFFDQELPRYALLSHTWGDEEITLHQLELEGSATLLIALKAELASRKSADRNPDAKQGLIKIAGCAVEAEKQGIKYIWCDTCCIDKTSSAELSEAINSMYHWYEGRPCFAYLADVPHVVGEIPLGEDSAFAKSRWFTRGWTLQELIAPSKVMFFDESWGFIGDRSTFRNSISRGTGIDQEVLDGADPRIRSIAKRMSWASQRETTRLEDTAYCLMGLFDVNMPLLYGERGKAFLRLQEEIMKTSEDHSLFAWKKENHREGEMLCGLLAGSPFYFSESHNIVPFSRTRVRGVDDHASHSMTNRGIRISLPMIRISSLLPITDRGSGEFFDEVLAILDCQDATDMRGPLSIHLLHTGGGYYRRATSHRLFLASKHDLVTVGEVQVSEIYVSQYDVAPKGDGSSVYQFHVQAIAEELSKKGVVLKVFPNSHIASWDPDSRTIRCSQGVAAGLFVGNKNRYGLMAMIGISPQLRAECVFVDSYGFLSLLLNEFTIEERQVPNPRGVHKLSERSIARQNFRLLTKQGKMEKPGITSGWPLAPRRSFGLLELEYSGPKPTLFNQFRERAVEILEIKINLEEEVVKGQNMFSVGFEVSKD